MKINLLYDYLTPYGYIPNTLNPNYLSPLIKNNFIIDHKVLEEYENGVGAIPVMSGLNVIFPVISEKYTVSDLYQGFNDETIKIDENEIFLYLVSPYGGASSAFGFEGTFNEKKSFFHFISKTALELIKKIPNVYLFINYSIEGTVDLNWYDVIHKDSKKFNIPLDKIVFCISDYFIDMNYKIAKKMYGIKDKGNIKLLYLSWSLHDKSKELLEIYNGGKTSFNQYSNECSIVKQTDIDLNRLRPKKFLMYNRRLRPHRIYSICHFDKLKIMEQFLISYDISNMQMYEMSSENIEMHIENKEHQNFIITQFNKLLKESPKQTIDYDDLENVWGFNFETKEPYLNSYIHITSETNFFELGGYFSEKTWKPIGHLQPFIFMGPAHGLKELKKLGFKTFSPYICEDYDNELDPEKRFNMIISEIERLSKIPIEEIHEWYTSIYEDILLYNRDKFFEYSDFKVNEKIVKDKFKEIFYDNTTLTQ
jgi:hypothetical protein